MNSSKELGGATVDPAAVSGATPEAGQAGKYKALPLDFAPRDGTMLRLLVDYADQESWTPLEDSDRAWTIGFNSLENTGEDRWQFVGWLWTQDCFVDGFGQVIGWLPFHGEAAGDALTAELLAALVNMVEDGDATDRKQALAAIANAARFDPATPSVASGRESDERIASQANVLNDQKSGAS